MKISTRELVLGWLTMVTVLLGITYWLGLPKADEWKNAIKAGDALELRKKEAQHLIGGREDINQRFDVLRQSLPKHPAGKDVTAELGMDYTRADGTSHLDYSPRGKRALIAKAHLKARQDGGALFG